MYSKQKIDDTIRRYRATGRIATCYRVRPSISLNGAPPISVDEAIAKMERHIELDSKNKKEIKMNNIRYHIESQGHGEYAANLYPLGEDGLAKIGRSLRGAQEELEEYPNRVISTKQSVAVGAAESVVIYAERY